jgi:hypothetical protein
MSFRAEEYKEYVEWWEGPLREIFIKRSKGIVDFVRQGAELSLEIDYLPWFVLECDEWRTAVPRHWNRGASFLEYFINGQFMSATPGQDFHSALTHLIDANETSFPALEREMTERANALLDIFIADVYVACDIPPPDAVATNQGQRRVRAESVPHREAGLNQPAADESGHVTRPASGLDPAKSVLRDSINKEVMQKVKENDRDYMFPVSVITKKSAVVFCDTSDVIRKQLGQAGDEIVEGRARVTAKGKVWRGAGVITVNGIFDAHHQGLVSDELKKYTKKKIEFRKRSIGLRLDID